jgi:hypothetical protein
MENTHLVLLEIFEILASGSLLLCPNSEADALAKLGLYHRVNCWLSPSPTEDVSGMTKTLEYLFDPTHRDEIDTIRSLGHALASSTLSSGERCKRLVQLIRN